MGERGEEDGFCRFLIRDNATISDSGILIFFK